MHVVEVDGEGRDGNKRADNNRSAAAMTGCRIEQGRFYERLPIGRACSCSLFMLMFKLDIRGGRETVVYRHVKL